MLTTDNAAALIAATKGDTDMADATGELMDVVALRGFFVSGREVAPHRTARVSRAVALDLVGSKKGKVIDREDVPRYEKEADRIEAEERAAAERAATYAEAGAADLTAMRESVRRELRAEVEAEVRAEAAAAERAGDADQASVDEVREALEMLEDGNEEHFTKQGAPRVKALADILGKPVSKEVLDQALDDD